MAADPAPVWRLDISIPAPAVPAFEAALAGLGGAMATDLPEAGAPEAGSAVGLQVYLEAEPARPREHLGVSGQRPTPPRRPRSRP